MFGKKTVIVKVHLFILQNPCTKWCMTYVRTQTAKIYCANKIHKTLRHILNRSNDIDSLFIRKINNVGKIN